MMDLDTDIRYLKGVGPKKAEAFNKLGVNSVFDLINYYPRSYEDRSLVKKIEEIDDGEFATVCANIISFDFRRIRKNLNISKALVSDGNFNAAIVWFNQEFLRNVIKVNQKYWFYGKFIRKGLLLEVTNPVFSKDFEEFARITPIYSKISSITQSSIRGCVKNALESSLTNLKEIFSEDFLEKNNIADIQYAVSNIHFPESNDAFFNARRRLVFEELFLMQLGLLLIKKKSGEFKKGLPMTHFGKKHQYIKSLGFNLTNAQIRVIKEIEDDFKRKIPMNRLLQGDVGSGKTVVAACAIIDAHENGYMSALMAPTEILAKQHYDNLSVELLKIGIKTAYLGGKMPSSEKRDILRGMENNEYSLIIGTHALIQEDVGFSNLGLVITDEQHRFGVNQRSTLAKKGENPHVLVMTATPIPRTLALILYGDLDISIIDEMPPGRKRIETYAVTEDKRNRVYDFMLTRIKNKNQVYIVCPLIEENDDSDIISVEKLYSDLTSRFPDLNISLMHGRIKSADKDRIMLDFYEGRTDVLISTTVIEVGVNVPNASLMIIENAERFGLAQLHQLRGRVGRGSEKSYCIMFNQSSSQISKERMKIMEKSTDGFYISEEDLKLRGPGEFFGTRQHGIPEMKIANLYKDVHILKEAQQAAFGIVDDDKTLSNKDNIPIYEKINKIFENYSFI